MGFSRVIAYRVDGYGKNGLACHCCTAVSTLREAIWWFCEVFQQVGYERVVLTPLVR